MAARDAQLIADFAKQVKELAHRFAAEQLAPERRDAGAASRTAERLAAIFEMAVGRVDELIPPQQPLACCSGCSWCCCLVLLVEAPFVLWLADTLRARADPASLAALGHNMTLEGGACPLLADDGRCQTYDTRPLVCRAHSSIDADACARQFADEDVIIESRGGQSAIWHAMAVGLAEAMNAAGLGRDTALHFRRAMVVALAMPDASARWAAGEDIFAVARSPECDQGFRTLHGN
ncbi:MAG: YkgJ family cysteine cluster protein [Rhodospirillaceae bacterium]|nr:YkgJ family cysteine cluster protein [Rhodospirillales bacterium]